MTLRNISQKDLTHRISYNIREELEGITLLEIEIIHTIEIFEGVLKKGGFRSGCYDFITR